MGVETPIVGIWSLDEAWPLTTDSRREGDNHLRLIKDAIKKTFANVNAVVDCTDEELNILAGALVSTAELNYLQGATSNIQTQIDDPTIMHTDENNTTTGFFEVDNNLIDINRDISVTLKSYLRLRGDLEVIKWQFLVYGIPDATRPEAFAIANVSADPKFICRTDAGTLELTSTAAEWEGNALGFASDITDLDTATAKKSDFIILDTSFTTSGTNATFTINTTFGSSDFTWGIGGIKRNDGTDPNVRIIGVDDNDFKQYLTSDEGITEPSEPAIASAGQVNFAVRGDAGGTIGWTMRFWARKNI